MKLRVFTNYTDPMGTIWETPSGTIETESEGEPHFKDAIRDLGEHYLAVWMSEHPGKEPKAADVLSLMLERMHGGKRTNCEEVKE
jgi:hypothetical protein